MADLTTVEAMRRPVTHTYQGVDVTDDYEWLEDASSEDTQMWSKAQQERTTAYLGDLPFSDAIRRRAREVIGQPSTSYLDLRRGGELFFALTHQPPKQQPFLVAFTDVGDAATQRVVVDPNVIDESGATTIDWYVPSPDGRLVAVSLSSNGTEDGSLHVFDASSGELVDAPIPRITMMGGSLAWRGDASGFWYTRYPAPGERPQEDLLFYQEVWSHTIGQTSDRRELGDVFADDRIVENVLSSSSDGGWVLDRAQRGDGNEWELFVRAQDGGGWWKLAEISDKVMDAAFGGGRLFLLSRAGAPNGRILRLSLVPGATVADATEIVPEA
jgi:prolyl oligopeptidase